ncbi:MAG: DUF805 domain-containing protein [Pseudomonadota bacterium]
MTFTESISTCFNKYATFEGTASRSEYWWFMLFLFLGSAAASVISDTLSILFSLATILPSLAAACRRLHDTDRSGWWQLIWLVPFIGWVILIVFLVQESRPNRYSQGLPLAA